MSVSPEDRQLAIDLFAQALSDAGLDDEEAQDYATAATDQAISQRESSDLSRAGPVILDNALYDGLQVDV